MFSTVIREEIAKGEIKFSTKIFNENSNYLDKVVWIYGISAMWRCINMHFYQIEMQLIAILEEYTFGAGTYHRDKTKCV